MSVGSQVKTEMSRVAAEHGLKMSRFVAAATRLWEMSDPADRDAALRDTAYLFRRD